jgi:pSer/pThr/pTyr-binding forkhead associated (FHA) protein
MSFEAHMRIGSLEITAAMMAVAAVAVLPRAHVQSEIGVIAPLRLRLKVVELDDVRTVDAVCPVVVGRSSDCGVTLADQEVSRRHVRFETGEGIAYIRDLGSSNGTFLNGQRVREAIEVRAGDTVDVGVTRLVIEDIAPWM